MWPRKKVHKSIAYTWVAYELKVLRHLKHNIECGPVLHTVWWKLMNLTFMLKFCDKHMLLLTWRIYMYMRRCCNTCIIFQKLQLRIEELSYFLEYIVTSTNFHKSDFMFTFATKKELFSKTIVRKFLWIIRIRLRNLWFYILYCNTYS